jgi:hypothetical protein
MAPSYFIIAGIHFYEGAVITRDRFAPANINFLSER